MSERPVVSVVMAVLAPHPRYFPEAVRAVLGQTLDAIELIVVEDPQEGATPAAELLADLDDPRVRLLSSPTRTSLVDQRNRGLEAARAELVAVADADDVCEPARLARQREFLLTHPDVAVVGSQLSIVDADGAPAGSRRYPTTHEAIVAALPRYNALAQPAAMFRREVVRDAGGYAWREYGCMAEDYELWSRLALGGARLANLDEALVRYRVHPGGCKATRLRQLLGATIAIKRRHWSGRMNAGDRLRLLAERALLCLPPSLVLRLFERLAYRR